MQKIMFDDKCGLTAAVLEGRKNMTRRFAEKVLVEDENGELHWNGEFKKPRYKVGEVVAVAQSYKDALGFDGSEYWQRHSAGWDNKMFVKADLMPCRIKVTKAKVERLQDICAEDAIREGVQCVQVPGGWRYVAGGERITKEDRERILSGEMQLSDKCSFNNHLDAFAKLINKVSGKGTWERNPWVFAYSFELVK